MKIICIGRNYVDHISELNNERPEHPVVFLKPQTSIILEKQPFFIPDFTSEVHYEVELLVKINRLGKHIESKFAHKYYDEIGLGIDFTARDVQAECKKKGLPWEKAKAFDNSAKVGQWVSKADFEDLQDLKFELKKNDQTVQSGHTKMMLWPIDELIAYVSRYFTLKIGDIIFTGTPAGVGPVTIGDQLNGYLEGKHMFKLDIK
jgi:2-keto-4-pentenoate hydratase/2-oxohepta-3-ene-1,7-dioic acid hydratase in catechol pathway